MMKAEGTGGDRELIYPPFYFELVTPPIRAVVMTNVPGTVRSVRDTGKTKIPMHPQILLLSPLLKSNPPFSILAHLGSYFIRTGNTAYT